MKAQIYSRIGNHIGGNGGGSFALTSNLFSTQVRCLHEPTKYAGGTIFLNETSGLLRAGAGCDSRMYDVATADSGVPQQVAIATGPVAIVAGKQWTNLAGIISGIDTNCTVLTLTSTGFLGAVAGVTTVAGVPVSQISVGGFAFTLPVGAIINELFVTVRHAQVNISFTNGVFAACNNGAGIFPFAGTQAQHKVDINGTVKTATMTNSAVVAGNCAAHVLGLTDVDFNFLALGLTVADLNGETYTLKVEGDYPFAGLSPFPMIEHLWDAVSITAGYGLDVDALTVNQVVATRVRSADLTALLVDQDRYITHFNSTAGNRIGHAHSLLIAEVSV